MLRLVVSAALAGWFLMLTTSSAQSQTTAPPSQSQPQVVLEVRLLTVSEAFFERLALDFEIIKSAETSAETCARQPEPDAYPASRRIALVSETLSLAFLSDVQLFHLLETAQGDRKSNVVQAPKMTLDSGQLGKIDLTETKLFLTCLDLTRDGGYQPRTEAFRTGFRMTARPVVSADMRFVKLGLTMHQTELVSVPMVPIQIPVQSYKDKAYTESPPAGIFQMFLQQPQFRTAAFENTITIPDGGTAVLGGFKKITEARNEFGPPVLSRIPYVSRLFRNVGYGREAESLLILVTPRILCDDDTLQTATAVGQGHFVPVSSAAERPARVKQASAQCESVAGAAGATSSRHAHVLAELLRAYDEASAAGRAEDAERLARAALILNPTCFHNRR